MYSYTLCCQSVVVAIKYPISFQVGKKENINLKQRTDFALHSNIECVISHNTQHTAVRLYHYRKRDD